MFKNELVSLIMAAGAAAGTTMTVTTNQSIFGQADVVALSFIGTSIATVIASTVAALLAMGVSKPIEPRSTMWLYFVISAFLGAAVAAVLPYLPLVGDELAKAPAGPIAFIASFPARWVIPVIIEETPKRVKKLISGSSSDGEPS